MGDRVRALRSLGVPCREDLLEDRQGDGRQEDGGPALAEVERDGGVQLRAAAAVGRRHVQELRGPLAHRVLGRQWRGDAWQDHDGGAEGGEGQEVSACHRGYHTYIYTKYSKPAAPGPRPILESHVYVCAHSH